MIRVPVEIGTGPEDLVPAEFTVDRGSLYSLVSPSLAKSLGIRFQVSAPAKNSQGKETEMPLGLA